jgi:acetyl-CoA carboxylase biotin carboxylase subunit
MQRRNQKIIEECPSPMLTEKLRSKMGAAAVKLAEAVKYEGAGTIEYLLDDKGNYYFMEMNTRIQVEHTVTEEVFGVDLVREQMKLALGEPLRLSENLRPRGHSIEVRINAEDPVTFAPSPGLITGLNLPGGPGVRVDTHIYAQYRVPPNYDSLLAKLIVRADNRPAAVIRMRRALAEFIVEGPKTNIDFHKRLLDHPDFIAGRLDTRLVERM